MSRKRILALVFSSAVGIGIVLFAHAAIKLPSEPFWSSVASIYENYALALAIAFSIPYPMWTAGILLLVIMALVYLLIRRLVG